MKREDIENVLRKAITEVCKNVDSEEIKDESLLEDDLGFDSLDIVELIMKVEKAFNIGISDEEIEDEIKEGSFLNIVNFLSRKIG